MTPLTPNRLIFVLLVAFGLIMNSATNVWAYDEQGSFYSHGGVSCGQLTEDLKKGQAWEIMYEMYLQGYLAGINATIPGKTDFFVGTDSVSRFKFVAKYCEDNPLNSIISGINELVKKMTGKDMQHLAPQSFQNPK